MQLAYLLTFAVLNFVVMAAYLVMQSRRTDYPIWVYLLAVLFGWFPPLVYLLLFNVERWMAGEQVDWQARFSQLKIRLGWLVLCSSSVVQVVAIAIASSSDGAVGDVPDVVASFVSLVLSLMMLLTIDAVKRFER